MVTPFWKANKGFPFKATTISLLFASLFTFSSVLSTAQGYEPVGKYTVETQGDKHLLVFNGTQDRFVWDGGTLQMFKDWQFKVPNGDDSESTVGLGFFDEVSITSKSGAFKTSGALYLVLPNTKFTINNTGYGDALGVEGWQDAFKVRELWITTDASYAAALKSKIGRDFLNIEADVLNIRVNGNNKVYGVKVSPGLEASAGPGLRHLKFGSTDITMANGGVGVYTGFDDHEFRKSEIRPGTKFSLITAELGDTHIVLEGTPKEGHYHGNVGLFAAGLGYIQTEAFTFTSTIAGSTALKAEVLEYKSWPDVDGNGNTSTAKISINGKVKIEGKGNLAAYAGRNGTIEINPAEGSHPIQIEGDILASGENASIVINANSQDSLLTSNIKIGGDAVGDQNDKGAVSLGLGNGARWNVKGSSHVTSLKALEGNAYVDLTYESETRNTLVIDDLQGNAQLTFVLHSDIVGDKNAKGANDTVVIKGVSSDAKTHTLHIPSGGAQGEKEGGYLVYVPNGAKVDIKLNETHHSDSSVHYPVVDKGLYLYTLAKDENLDAPAEVVQGTREAEKYDAYYLTLAGFTPEQKPGEDPKPGEEGKPNKPVTPLLSPTAKAVLAMAGMGGQNAMYHNQLSDLRKRLGEVRGMTESNGLWVSASGQRDRFDGFASNGVKQNAYRFNLGLDHKIGSWLIGANFKYLHGTQKTSNPDSHARGKVNSAGANIYGTWIAENGLYTDIVASFDHYHQKITTSMLDGRGVSGKVNNFGLGLSAEVGKKFGLTKDFFVEPQAQLAYYWIKGKDFSMSNGMKVEQDDFNSLVGRLGVVAGKDFKDAEGNTKGQVFVKGGVKQQFAGKQKLRANSVQFKDELKGTSGYYGLGFEANPNKKVSLYGHVERENGKHYTKEIEVMLGLRYKF